MDGASLLDEIVQKFSGMTPEERSNIAEAARAAVGDRIWLPNPGPQTDAYFNPADVLLYGGSGGGGKTDLLTGLAIEEHHISLLMRRKAGDVQGLIDRAAELLGKNSVREGNRPRATTRSGGHINFGGAQHAGDEEAWQGRPRDLLGLDEVTHFLESQARFLMAWVRTVREGQRARTVFASNPPVDARGDWIIPFFGPWLDPLHHNPAKPGELRWFITDPDGKDLEVEGPELVQLPGVDDAVKPQSRTFIPAKLSDNPYLVNTGYKATLDSLPEPLRSSIRDGNFMAARQDADWQIIPSAWVRAAQERWTETPPDVPMCAIGVDVSRGGKDETVIATRRDGWFAPLSVHPGSEMTDGEIIAGLVIGKRLDEALPVIDMGGGWGTSPFDVLKRNGVECLGYVGASASVARTEDRALGFLNLRAESWWRLREALDPEQQGGSPIMLPDDPALVADLTAPTYRVPSGRIQVEAKEDTKTRLGRSTDRGDAVVMAWHGGPRWKTDEKKWRAVQSSGGTPKVNLGRTGQKRRRR